MSGEVDMIKERLDVADVVGEYVPLKRVGAHFKGLCPFHQEKTPSFIVSPQKGIWHCFGCHKGGDVFTFVQEIEGIDFAEALKMLAERAGVELRSTRLRQGYGEAKQGKQRLLELLSLAAKFYHTILMQHSAGRKAKEYLQERGVKEETMREFEIGYAPMKWDSLQQFLSSKEFRVEEMIQAGVVGEGQSGKSYDRFRGRIMFPITDVQGRVVAFGGRIVPWHATGEEGKYINSPETSLYEKRRIVFNLSRAKAQLRHQEPCVVVEGYMDAVLLTQVGIKNVVASSGTAFTPEQIALLKRYTSTLHFSFDADSAGEGATIAATQEALAAGMRVATIVLPAGQDPADVAARDPSQAVRIFESPQSLPAVLLARLAAEAEPAKREEALAALAPFIRRVSNVVLQGEMVGEIASLLHIPESEIIRLLGRVPIQVTEAATDEFLPNTGDGQLRAEQELLGLLITSSAARQAVWGKLKAELFIDDGLRGLYNTMHTLEEHHTMERLNADEEALLAWLPPALHSLVLALSEAGEERLLHAPDGPVAEAWATLRTLQRRHLRTRLQHMQAKLAQASESERPAVMQQFQQVAEELAEVTAAQA